MTTTKKPWVVASIAIAIAMSLLCLPSSAQQQQAASPSSSSSSSTDCVSSLLTLTDCLAFVTGNGSVGPPASCCTELSGVIDGEPICLCQLYNSTLVSSFGLTINYTAASALPSVCNLTTPPTSECQAVGITVPGSTPASAPVASTSPVSAPSAATPTLAPSPTGEASSPAVEAPSPSVALPPVALTPGAEAPISSATCLNDLLTLSDCLEYVTGNGSTTPSGKCCSELSPIITNEPICLCQLYNATLINLYSIQVNYTTANELPSACNLTTPDVSECAAVGINVGPAPSATPAESPELSPSPGSSPSAGSSASPGSNAPPPPPSFAAPSLPASSLPAMAFSSMVALLSLMLMS